MTAVNLEIFLLPFMGKPHRPDEMHLSNPLASAAGASLVVSSGSDKRCLQAGGRVADYLLARVSNVDRRREGSELLSVTEAFN